MTSEHGHSGEHEPPQTKYFYFVDDTKYEHDSASITGAQIRARIPGLDPNFQIFLEGHGGAEDSLVAASTGVNLDRQGQGVPRLYTAPPATFG